MRTHESHPDEYHDAAQAPIDVSEQHEHHVSVGTYLLVFAALMVLLVVTVLAAIIDLGPLGIAVALTIAVVKAVLIVLYFMHVRYSSRLIWLFSLTTFFWVAIMIGFVFTDYLTRPVLEVQGR